MESIEASILLPAYSALYKLIIRFIPSIEKGPRSPRPGGDTLYHSFNGSEGQTNGPHGNAKVLPFTVRSQFDTPLPPVINVGFFIKRRSDG
jgi:hypothetical protein